MKPLAQLAPVQVLAVHVMGCVITQPIQGDDIDGAVWSALRRFNYDPTRFRGWTRIQASKGSIAVRVS